MARKKRGKRVAAKQAQLSRRKKKGRGPSGIPTMSAAQRRRQPVAASTGASTTEGTTPQTAPATASATSTAPQAAAAVASRQPLVYSYVGKEMRRILILSGVIITAIIVLSFFLN